MHPRDTCRNDTAKKHLKRSKTSGTSIEVDSQGNRERDDGQRIELSIVIPIYNEVDSFPLLYEQLCAVLEEIGKGCEVIFVDDGSTDASFSELERLADLDDRVKAMQFRRNFGKASALMAGFREANGDFVVTMDGDLQDDPTEIPRFLDELEKGPFDLVSGWKYPRRDPLSKTVPSLLFNLVTSVLGGIKLHDFNCGFKAYRREVIEDISVYGELYRYIPVMAHWKGYRVGEIRIRHHVRRFGRSKYGASRILRGFFDLLTVLFLTRYVRRPLHLFGLAGLMSFFVGTGISAYLTVLWFTGERPIGDRPLLTLGVLLIIIGVQFFTLGLIAELVTSVLASDHPQYSIRRRTK